jgi:hypothetical protein
VATVSSKKTLIWAGILLVLGAFYYLYEIQGGQKRQTEANKSTLLLQLAADDVTRFIVKRAQDTIRAEKRDGHWYLTEPLQVRGDDQKYGELTRYVADLHHTRVVEEHPPSLEPYGLATPTLEIQVTLKNQSTPSILHLGSANPTGGSYYMHIEGRPAVYLVSGVAKDVLDAALYALRDKTVLAFTPAEVQAIHLAHGTAAPIILQRQAEDTWGLSAPVQAKADMQQVRGMIQRLHDAKVQTFITEDATDLASYGLQTPVWHVALQLGAGHTPLTLSLGNVNTEQKGVYAKHDEAARVFLLPQELWDNLPKTMRELRDKTLLHYERDHVTRMEVHTPTETLLVTSTGPHQYTLEQPVQAAGDGDAIYSWLWDIRDLKAKDFVAETPEALERYGLDAPRWRCTVWEKAPAAQEPAIYQLVLGAEAPNGEGVYARLGEEPVIYLVGKTEAERIIQKTAFDLRNKKILAFTTDTIQKIVATSPSAQFVVERTSNTWKLLEPHKQNIPQRWKIDQMLYELSTLAYVKIVADPLPTDVAPYGLDTPQMSITLWQQDGSTIGPLLVGKTTNTEVAGTKTVYTQAGPHTPLYAVKADFLKSMPKTSEELTAEK